MIETRTGRVRLAENVHGLEELDVASELAAVLGMPVTVENDVNLAALGEHDRDADWPRATGGECARARGTRRRERVGRRAGNAGHGRERREPGGARRA